MHRVSFFFLTTTFLGPKGGLVSAGTCPPFPSPSGVTQQPGRDRGECCGWPQGEEAGRGGRPQRRVPHRGPLLRQTLRTQDGPSQGVGYPVVQGGGCSTKSKETRKQQEPGIFNGIRNSDNRPKASGQGNFSLGGGAWGFLAVGRRWVACGVTSGSGVSTAFRAPSPWSWDGVFCSIIPNFV